MNKEEIIQWLREYSSKRINSVLIDERRCIPPYIVLDFARMGIFAMGVPKEYKGFGWSLKDIFDVVQQIAAIDTTLASFVGVNNALGIFPIITNGSQEQKDYYLPLMAEGKMLGSFAYTEPEVGSNVQAIQSYAEPCEGGYKLYGTKIWIGSAAWSEVITTFVKVPEGKFSNITAFLLKNGQEGLTMGDEALTLGLKGMVQNQVIMEGVKVTEKDLLGKVGNGLVVAEEIMNMGRFGICAMALGAMKRCLQLMFEFASQREVSSGKLIDTPEAKAMLSQGIIKVTALDAMFRKMVDETDEGKKIPGECLVLLKVLAAEFTWEVVDSGVQLLGGRGYVDTNILSIMMRDVRIFRIFEGTSEVLLRYSGSCFIYQKSRVLNYIKEKLSEKEYLELENYLFKKKEEKDDELKEPHAAKVVATMLLFSCLDYLNVKSLASDFKSFCDMNFHHLMAYPYAPIFSDQIISKELIEESIKSFEKNIGYIHQHGTNASYETDLHFRDDV